MSIDIPILLAALACALVLDAFRRPGSLVRPEFYLLFSLFCYETFGFLFHMYYTPPMDFMIPAPEEYLIRAYMFSLSAMVGIYLGGGLYRGETVEASAAPRDQDTAFIATMGAIAAIVYAFYLVVKAGALSPSFLHRDYFTTIHGITLLPYGQLFTVCLVLVAFHEQRIPWSILLWIVFGATIALLGSRRLTVYSLLTLFIVKQYRGWRVSKSLAMALGFAVLLAALTIGALRGGRSLETLNMNHYLANMQEFGRVFSSQLYYTLYPPEENLWGQTMLDAVIVAIPGPLSPFEEPTKLAQGFRGLLHKTERFTDDSPFPPGSGFSAVAEARLNFGEAGPFLFFAAFAWVLSCARRSFTRNGWPYLNAILAVYCYGIGRGGTQDIIIAAFIDLFLLAFVFTIVGITRKHERNTGYA